MKTEPLVESLSVRVCHKDLQEDRNTAPNGAALQIPNESGSKTEPLIVGMNGDVEQTEAVSFLLGLNVADEPILMKNQRARAFATLFGELRPLPG